MIEPPVKLNRSGNGRGLKLVTRAPVKKPERVSMVRAKRDALKIPTAEIATTLDPNKPLTEKAKLFVKYWAQGESIQSAGVKAGYAAGVKYIYKLVHFPQAIALYKAEKAKYEEAAQMTRKKVMDGLLEGIEMCRLTSDGPGVIAGWKTVGQLRVIQQGATAELELLESSEEDE